MIAATLRALPVMALLACASPDPVDPPGPPSFASDTPRAVRAERLAAGTTDATWMVGGRALHHTSADVWLHDPRAAEPAQVLQAQQELRGGAWIADGELLVAVSGALWFWDGQLWPTPLSDAVSGEVQELRGLAEGVRWIRDDTGWHWSQGGVWSTPMVNGAPCTEAMVALSPTRAWLQQGDGLALLRRADSSWEAEEHWEIEGLRQFGVDGEGTVWATDGLDLHQRTGPLTWTTHELPAAVAQLAAHPASAGVWVQTTEQSYFGDADGVDPVDVAEGWWLGADPLGGLLVRDTDSVSVVRAAPGLALWDVPPGGVEDITDLEVTLQPSTLGELDRLELSLNGAQIPVPEAPPYTVAIDTRSLERGTHVLEATGIWSGGTEVRLEQELTALDGVVTWRQHVQPIFQESCEVCHGGSADTVLDRPDDWSSDIDNILDQLDRARMPLGEDPLPKQDIDLIRAWRDGGFL